ncbi:GNAT family N-acetyltransferase [Bacillus sp. NPDC077027]|uniref:GNAT family N-acetyltransferase n=1 Tax=Bacillus sp. NPDC077027 TaxID=3390548 RepID=UPI003D00DCC5
MYIINESRHDEIMIMLREKESDYPTFVDAILDGSIPGVVYVDDPKVPSVFFVGTEGGIFFIGGDERHSSFLKSVVDLYEWFVQQERRFTLFSANERWNTVIKGVLGEQLEEMWRFSFLSGTSVSHNHTLQKPFTIQQIDQHVIA